MAYKKNEYPDSFLAMPKIRFEQIIVFDSFKITQHATKVCSALINGILNTKFDTKLNKNNPNASIQEILSSRFNKVISKIPQYNPQT